MIFDNKKQFLFYYYAQEAQINLWDVANNKSKQLQNFSGSIISWTPSKSNISIIELVNNSNIYINSCLYEIDL